MNIRRNRLAVICLALVVSKNPLAETMSPGRYKAPILVALRLPKFCHAQYFDRKEPEYSIPKATCGPLMNHYCPGLVFIMESRRPSLRKGERLQKLQRAKTEILYTVSGMKDYPNCPIKNHVEMSLAEVEATLRGMGKR